MRRLGLVCVALASLLAGTTVVRAQSLGEVAKKEQEKQERKKKEKSGKPPAKVYTEEDLKKARESEAGAVTVLPENGNVESGSASSSSDDDEAVSGEGRPAGGKRRTETYWRGRATRARDAVNEADAKVKDLEARVTAIRNDLNPVNTQDPNRLQTRDRELREAIDALEAARQGADAARKALSDLEEEARRAGALPGWLR
jgi:hypothetical protein